MVLFDFDDLYIHTLFIPSLLLFHSPLKHIFEMSYSVDLCIFILFIGP